MTLNEFINFLPLSVKALLAIGVVIGAITFRSLDGLNRYLYFYILLMAVFEAASSILLEISNSNMIVLPIYCAVEVMYFTFLYNIYLLSKQNNILKILSFGALFYIIFETIYYFVLNDINVKFYQPYAKVADNFVIIMYALYFIYEKVNLYNEQRWDNFRLNIIVLIAFTLTLIVFLPFNFLVNEETGIKFIFWLVNIVVILLFYGYLIWHIWRNGRIRKL
ncbi:hypothetical protein KJK34_08055 [Flavobacterium sp. D11R37]|uniref:hypothetical protein n=1 Tax=Flavobacterium coralii TaxID=2838017 RepID=UPI001CA735E4|nr:hypothetical protein [Flavobacterium coralii]MBY8962701.1 hypothetical protein [Flavobacterium coralii]